MVAKLGAAWALVPDWRLGQLISNLMGPGRHDIFFPDDAEWNAWLDQFLTQTDEEKIGG